MSNTKKPPTLIVKLPQSIYTSLRSQSSSFTTSLHYNPSSSSIQLSLPSQLLQSSQPLTFSTKIEPVDQDLYIFVVDGQNQTSLKSQIKHKGILIPSRPIYAQEPVLQTIPSIQTIPQGKPEVIQSRVFHLHPNHKAYTSSNPQKALMDSRNKKPGDRRVRGEREKIKEYLFTLFAKQRY